MKRKHLDRDKHELLTLWFLRLNGYFCVPNFIVHPDAPGPQHTDADILAVRFPYCQEVAGAPMPQDEDFVVADRIDFLVAEVKSGECLLNGPWVAPGRRNIQYVLAWMGFLATEAQLNEVAKVLYERKRWEDRQGPYSVRMVCFGSRRSSAPGMRDVLQRTHLESVRFILDRFRKFETQKADQRQWDPFIRKLFDMASRDDPFERIMEWIDGNAQTVVTNREQEAWLSWIQREALSLAGKRRELRRHEVIARFRISRETARRELSGWCGLGWLRLVGGGRDPRYVPLSFWLSVMVDGLEWAMALV